jgi:hypothetical protein
MTRKDAKRKADEFLVWRAGNAANWDCTREEIAHETGFSISKVGQILNRRGWKTQAMDYAATGEYGGGRLPVDLAMSITDTRTLGRS